MKGNIFLKGITLFVCLLMVSIPTVIAQDCEGNFDCDQDVDGSDAAVFKEDFGRSAFKNPCATCLDSPCPCITTTTTTTTICPTLNLCSQPEDCMAGDCCCTDGSNYICYDETDCLDWGECETTTTTCVEDQGYCTATSQCCEMLDWCCCELEPTVSFCYSESLVCDLLGGQCL